MFDVLICTNARSMRQSIVKNKLVLRGANNGQGHRKCRLWILETWKPLEILLLRR